MKHYNIIVSGKVQGVFYRQSTLEMAQQLDIKGFVRNEPNGNVYIEAECEAEQLHALLKWCQQGPSRAKVDGVKFSEGNLTFFTLFEINR